MRSKQDSEPKIEEEVAGGKMLSTGRTTAGEGELTSGEGKSGTASEERPPGSTITGEGRSITDDGAQPIDDQEQSADESPLSKIKVRRAIYPIIIGLGVVVYMIYRDFNPDIFDNINLSWHTIFWLFIAIVFMLGRDVGYIIRIRVLSQNRLTWRQAFRVIMLWEFTSAITPSVVGGTSVAIVYVHKEGISIGRSSAMVMVTSFLDELYFVVMFPLILLLVGVDNIFNMVQSGGVIAAGVMGFTLIGYCLKLAYLIVLSYGLFINPRGLKWLLMKIFRWRPLKRWYRAMNNVGTEMINSSREMRSQGIKFWFKAGASTFLSWSSRYLVANALILAFFSVSDHVLLFARQLVMWIMMLVMPTPGGSGFAEAIFTTYCSDLIAVPIEMQLGAAAMIALLWRLITYYPYLVIGAIIFPRWIKSKFGSTQK